MTDDDDLLALDRRHVWHPFTQAATAPPPLLARSASGARISTADGTDYVDLVSSWWVNIHGHAHPAIAAAIAEQASRLEQVIFAEFTHAPAINLAARLCAMLPSGLNRVFYSDDGSTAVEVALKMALQYWQNVGAAGRRRFVAFDRGYHGDTVGAMSAGRGSGYFRAWEGMLFPVAQAPFPATWLGDDEPAAGEAAALAAVAAELARGDIAAVIIEPLIQGAAGMRMCRPQFLRALAALVRAEGALLIFDEVMTGFGRTGASFACIGAAVAPDLICLSKGLSGGFMPIAATIATDAIHNAFLGTTVERAFLHGHSFTANPLGCAAALVSLDLLADPDCARRIAAIGALHAERLARLSDRPAVSRPRHCGTIAALDLNGGETGYGATVGAVIKARFRAAGLLVRPLGDVFYLLPPYCIEAEDLHRAYDLLEDFLGPN